MRCLSVTELPVPKIDRGVKIVQSTVSSRSQLSLTKTTAACFPKAALLTHSQPLAGRNVLT